MKNIFKRYETVTDFERYLCTEQTQRAFVGKCASDGDGVSSTGTHDFAEADSLLRYGDKETADELEKRGLSRLRKKATAVAFRRQLFPDVVGHAAHVPNYIAGVPTAMINVKQTRVKERVVTVCYNISQAGGVSADAIKTTAVEVLGAVMLMEASGVRVNLYVCDISDTDRQSIGWLLKIKDSKQALNVLKTAYVLCHPSMLRRHSFRWTEVTKGVCAGFYPGYGRASNNTEEMLSQVGLRNVRSFRMNDVRGLEAEQIAEKILSGAGLK